MTKVATLARDCYCFAIHGVTGRAYEEGTLAAGTLIRDVRTAERPRADGAHGVLIETSFEASTDGGQSWYRQRTTDKVEVEEAGR